MSAQALDRLVAEVRSLPGDPVDLGLPRAVATDRPDALPLAPAALRARTANLLAALADRAATTLPEALARTHQAWDQADAFAILDAELRADAIELRRAAAASAQADEASTRAAGVEARLLVDAAVGLATLLERRFAALVRLRLRSATPELIVDGRPFLDVAAALAEAARRWR